MLYFMIFWHLSPESTQTWSLGGTKSEIWIGKIWYWLKFYKKNQQNEHTPGSMSNCANHIFTLISYQFDEIDFADGLASFSSRQTNKMNLRSQPAIVLFIVQWTAD